MPESKIRSFDLDREMLSLIEAKFSPDLIAEQLSIAVEGKPSSSALEIGSALFTEYGRQWAKWCVDLGRQYPDRTYEVLQEAAAQTGRLVFPLFAQRFIEIAFLATQDISILPIVENNAQRLVFRVENCATYQAVAKRCSAETTRMLTCREGCLNLCRTILDEFRIQGVQVELVERTPDVGHCVFRLAKSP